MSLFKIMKAWRAALKFTVFRKGHKLPVGKTTVVPKAKEVKKETTKRDADALGPVEPETHTNQRFRSSLLRSVLSRYPASIGRHKLSYLRPRNSGVNRMRNVPIFSLAGLTLGVEMDMISDSYKESTMSAVRDIFKDYKWEPNQLENKPQGLDDLDINKISVIGNGCEGAVFEARLKAADSGVENYNLAVKAVFNYGAESNASSILRELKREIVPLQLSEVRSSEEEELINGNILHLPPHPNIVDMHGIFVDDMLVTEQGRREFPAAMPRRVDPEGCFGRNKTLYLVMRKCTTSLSEFLSPDVSMTTRCLLVAQLLEAVHHMTAHGVAHRDIKADNILIDMPVTRDGTPRLQLCDFGCCLAEKNKKLVLPYTCSDVNLGGNSWLMAPEIACATPGETSVLDYRKSDLWACGALAFQILGADNPFYPNMIKQLKSKTYSEAELPPLPDSVPVPIQRLVRSLLARDPSKRPSSNVAVLVIQMVIWELTNTSKSISTTRKCGTPSPSSSSSSSSSSTNSCGSYNNAANMRRRNHLRVTAMKAEQPRRTTTTTSKTTAFIQYRHKERQKMGLVLGKMFDLIRKIAAYSMIESGGSSLEPLKQDIVDITDFLCLSRLTMDDFVTALKFFHQ